MGTDTENSQHMLIVDDDGLLGDSLIHGLADLPLTIDFVQQGSAALAACEKVRYDLILLDQKLPDALGVDLCPSFLRHNAATKIIFMTAYPSFDNALAAIQLGAYDYLSKPFELEALRLVLKRAQQTARLERVAQADSYQREQAAGRHRLVGEHREMVAVRRLVDLAAREDAAVLIMGETGTGKGLAASSIHSRGRRGRAPFLQINCAAIPDHLMEAELFGYERGAFTGALGARAGIFEAAGGGSLLLDEIGELPLHLQAKLLGVLDDGKVKRIGSQAARHVDTRILAATNLALEKEMQDGRFRRDLYYRLSVIVITMPPLRTHLEDLPQLCAHFLRLHAPQRVVAVDPGDLKHLTGYHWPGNVRELRNILERALILQKGPMLFPSRLIRHEASPASQPLLEENPGPPLLSLKAMERAHILMVLSRCGHNHTHAAKMLEISRSTLIRKLKAYGIGNPKAAHQEIAS